MNRLSPRAQEVSAESPELYRKTRDGFKLNRRDAALLLRCGIWLLVAGCTAALLTKFVFGGITQHGAHGNTGWLLLVAAAACIPLGLMSFLMGLAKTLRRD